MSHAAKIRAALTLPRMTAEQVIEATGLTKKQFQQAMGQMVYDGHVLVDRTVWPRVYTIGRPPIPRAEMVRRNAAHLQAWNERRRLSKQEKLRRKREQDRAYDATRRKAQTLQRMEHSIAVVTAKALQSAPAVERIETVEEWMARTNMQPERLNPWDVSEHNRLKGVYA